MKLFILLRYLIEAIAGALFGPESSSEFRYEDDRNDGRPRESNDDHR